MFQFPPNPTLAQRPYAEAVMVISDLERQRTHQQQPAPTAAPPA
jgi:hypothetical protein